MKPQKQQQQLRSRERTQNKLISRKQNGAVTDSTKALKFASLIDKYFCFTSQQQRYFYKNYNNIGFWCIFTALFNAFPYFFRKELKTYLN